MFESGTTVYTYFGFLKIYFPRRRYFVTFNSSEVNIFQVLIFQDICQYFIMLINNIFHAGFRYLNFANISIRLGIQIN